MSTGWQDPQGHCSKVQSCSSWRWSSSPPTWTWARRLQMTRSEVDSRPWLSAKRRAQGLPLSWHGHRFQEKNVVGFDFKQLVSLCQTNGHKIPKSCDSKMLLAPPPTVEWLQLFARFIHIIMVKVAPNCLYLSFQVTSLPLPKHPVWLWCRQKPRFATGNLLLTLNPSSFQSLHPLSLLGWHHLTLDQSREQTWYICVFSPFSLLDPSISPCSTQVA